MSLKTQIKYIRSLHQKKYREKENVFIAEGIKIINEVLSAHPSAIKNLLYTPETKSRLKLESLSENIRQTEIPPGDFQKISILKNPQGVMAVIQKPDSQIPSLAKAGDLVLILDSIRDPGNLGTIIRLADWFGIGTIFCSEDTVECFNPKVVQATMGAIFRIKIFYTDLKNILREFRTSGATIYGSSLNGENIYVKKLQFPAAVILGNEAHGISNILESEINENLFIPNFSPSADRTESLNVSLAAAIICSEFRRQSV